AGDSGGELAEDEAVRYRAVPGDPAGRPPGTGTLDAGDEARPVRHREHIAQRRSRHGQARAMPQDVPYGDGVLAVAAEPGPVAGDRLIEVDLSFLDELMDHDGEVGLAGGEDPEQRVRCAVDGFVQQHAAVADHAELRRRATRS